MGLGVYLMLENKTLLDYMLQEPGLFKNKFNLLIVTIDPRIQLQKDWEAASNDKNRKE